MIKNILFDLDDTIFDFKLAEKKALTKALLSMGIQPDDAILSRYSELNIQQWKLLELGKITREEVKLRRFKFLFEELGVATSPSLATSLYEENLSKGHIYLGNAKEVLQSLCKHYSIYLVSNGSAKVQRGRIESSDLMNYLKGVFVSQTVGYDKPAPEFFDYCFSKTGIKRSETVIVGDSLTSDIQGGINAGITTIWFNRRGEQNNSDIIPDYEISDLSTLKALLKSI